MAYIAVNKSGDCIICEMSLIRFTNCKENDEKGYPYSIYSIRDMQEENHWIHDWSSVYKTEKDFALNTPKLGVYADTIKISPEAIRKLAGMDLTWEDEPIQI